VPEVSGRPTKLTPAIEERVLHAIKLGASRADAAQFAGIGERTLREWMRLGADEAEGPHAALRARVLEAEGQVKVTLVGCVLKAAVSDWRAALALLQCRHPTEFGDKSVLFLVRHALSEIEKAAELAGVALPESAWEQAWATVARQLAQKLPEAVAGIGSGVGGDYEGFETEEDLDLALKLLGRRRTGGNGSPP
jgi:hypothetical protein